MEENNTQCLTRLLKNWEAGDSGALEKLEPLIAPLLVTKARRLLQREAYKSALQPNELVQETWLRLLDSGVPKVKDHLHLLNLMTRIMRHILINQAMARKASKRCDEAGKTVQTIHLENMDELMSFNPIVHYELDHSLRLLKKSHPRKERIISLHYLCGFAQKDIAKMEEISLSTVKREIQLGFNWLKTRIKGVRHLA